MTSTTANKTDKVSPTVTLVIVAAVQFLVPFLFSSINVALPVIGRELNASAVQLGLIITVLALANTAVLLPVGRFADIYGRKRIFIIGTVILAISTLALGMAHSINIFIALRFVQGVGSAMIIATSFAILTTVFPPQRRGRAMGIVVAMVYLGISIGPSLSGIIVSHLGWRWVFFIVFAIILLALLMTLIWLKGEWAISKGEPYDYLGAVIFFISLCILIPGAVQIIDLDMAKWLVLSGVVGLGLFVWVEWKSPYPLLDLRLLIDNLAFTFSNLATFFNYASASSFVFFLSLYLQYVKALSPQDAGMLIIIQPVVQAMLALFTGRLADIYPPSRIATLGMIFCAFGLVAAALINPHTSYIYFVVVMVLLGMSYGLFSTPNMTAIMNSVGPRHHGTASSMVSTMRNTGMLFSTTTITVILSLYLGDQPITRSNIPQFIESMRSSLFLFSALSLLGTIFSMVKGQLATSLSASRRHSPDEV